VSIHLSIPEPLNLKPDDIRVEGVLGLIEGKRSAITLLIITVLEEIFGYEAPMGIWFPDKSNVYIARQVRNALTVLVTAVVFTPPDIGSQKARV
jgi:hypothetical protein